MGVTLTRFAFGLSGASRSLELAPLNRLGKQAQITDQGPGFTACPTPLLCHPDVLPRQFVIATGPVEEEVVFVLSAHIEADVSIPHWSD